MNKKHFNGKRLDVIAKSLTVFDEANPDEATYGNTRVAQKSLNRAFRYMVGHGMLPRDGDDERLMDLLNKWFYALEEYQLTTLFTETRNPLVKEEEPPIGGSSGGLLRWFVDHWGSK